MKLSELLKPEIPSELLQEAVYKPTSDLYAKLCLFVSCREATKMAIFKNEMEKFFETIGASDTDIKSMTAKNTGYNCYWGIEDVSQDIVESKGSIDKYIETLIPVFNKLYPYNRYFPKASEHNQTLVISNNMPSFPIFCRKDILISCKNLKTFNGAENIKNSEVLLLKDTKKWVGPVLGLLKSPAKSRIYCQNGPGQPDPGWFEILKRHWDSDRDILDCQEELITAGFKDYAKI